jgi:hypothetical protein
MFTLDDPVFVRLTVCDSLVPMVTLLKSSLAGFKVSWPSATPVPETENDAFGSEALLVIVMTPLKFPVVFGVKVTFSVAVCPAEIVIGRLVPDRAKLLLETEMPEIVIVAGPEFVVVTGRVLLLPAVTLPKARVVAATDNVFCVCDCLDWDPALTPWHAVISPIARITSSPADSLCKLEL